MSLDSSSESLSIASGRARRRIIAELQRGSLLRERFRIEGQLGTGGMGEVFLATDLEGGRLVALKRTLVSLRPQDEQFVLRRFRDETSILRRLDFPGVPAFVDAFDDGSQAYLAMEFIQGSSLDNLLMIRQASGASGLDSELVVQIGIQVCRILVYLHNHQPPLVHRDIKPANIIVQDKDDQVFLVDFGLAREISGDSSTKTMVGTAAYAPLEQFQGKPEPRSDLYALGVTMVQLLTGKSPIPLEVHPVQRLLPDLHEDLCRILNRATRSFAAERYRNAEDFLAMLEDVFPRLSEQQPVKEAPGDRVEALMRRWGAGKVKSAELPSPVVAPCHEDFVETQSIRPRRWFPWVLGLLLAVSIGLFATKLLRPPAVTRQPTRPEAVWKPRRRVPLR